ncbi:unnamed protein product [Linum trigynum]|uniref:Uncharacterized protein n=1 Tax=Linum trigynum TaxID=586398 RepID=A0AAV2D9I5_9ROSI
MEAHCGRFVFSGESTVGSIGLSRGSDFAENRACASISSKRKNGISMGNLSSSLSSRRAVRSAASEMENRLSPPAPAGFLSLIRRWKVVNWGLNEKGKELSRVREKQEGLVGRAHHFFLRV